MSGVVRAAVEEFWNDLKRAHYLDSATRAMVIQMSLVSNNAGVRHRVSFIFEFTATASLLPSYSTASAVRRSARLARSRIYLNLGLVLTLFFHCLEAVEIRERGTAYFHDVWNIFDWINFILYYN